MFMTAEAYNAIKEWMEFPVLFGEEITGESFKEIKDTGQVLVDLSTMKLQAQWSHI
jgi:hypothetical protein